MVLPLPDILLIAPSALVPGIFTTGGSAASHDAKVPHSELFQRGARPLQDGEERNN